LKLSNDCSASAALEATQAAWPRIVSSAA